ncbi:hypothetical protein [Streptomyces sp. GSL17-111]|uniref:hypothetical protein n=1 Tax=Streptomyces sp. GSL17-111 TaxID=3121596 RepID=UPI0030F46F40
MTLLTTHPEGLTGVRLAVELYGERDINPVTLRAELSRLRQLLGDDLRSRPYRLRTTPATDLDDVDDALRAHDLTGALAACRGPVLPRSEAPGIARVRQRTEHRLRHALLLHRDAGALTEWVSSPHGEEDLAAWEALLTVSPAAGRGVPAARVEALRAAYGLPGRGAEPGATSPQRAGG